jgi:protocatechuate 3,4-dioxygenase beta subunit
MKKRILTAMVWLLALMLLASCAQEQMPSDAPAQAGASTAEPAIAEPTSAPPQPTEAPTETAEPIPSDESPTAAPTATPALPATATSPPESIEVTYFTPAQQEGPYYTVNKPEDRDNDLTVLAGAAGSPRGQVIEFGGKVYDATGQPVPGAIIEIWQTDSNGVYLHPNDPSTGQRDPNFQFYGEAVTAADGSYSFRTILPGQYEPRPRHIHVNVFLEGQELLTTQFYFADDPDVASDPLFTAGDGAHLLIDLSEGQDAEGKPILVGQRDIVLALDLSS